MGGAEMGAKRLILFIVALLSLVSCRTQQVAEKVVTVVRYDTVIVNKTDTIKVTGKSVEKDTVRESHTYIYYINENGDTASTKVIHDNYHGSYHNDSTDYYRSLAEYYKEKSNEKNNTETVIVKDDDKKERIATIVVLIIILLTITIISRRK